MTFQKRLRIWKLKPDEKIVAEAVRVERDDLTGRMYIVFEVKDEKLKQTIIRDWLSDIEFKIIGKALAVND
jgi:hypothetical protein